MSTAEQPSQPQNALLASQQPQSFGDYVTDYVRRVRSGDFGSLPILVGLIFICAIFQGLNHNFLTPRNFVNLILQMAGITTIAYGVVFILLLGEIDLSVGYVSAVAGVTMTLLLQPSVGLPWFAAIPIALLIAAAIGVLHGWIITTFQVPSFVVTLAGLLAWNGVVLLIIGEGGTIIIQDKVVIGIASAMLPKAVGWLAAIAFVGWFAFSQYLQNQSRHRQGLTTKPIAISALQVGGLAVIAAIAVEIANLDEGRGVPVIAVIMIVLLWALTFLSERTRFGRYVFAIGGNKEATRRAGVKVERIRVYVFMISSLMAGVGGIILASRGRSVATNQGGGDLLLNSIAAAVIGGTSLFGGRGRVSSAVLGALIIASVQNGMGLLNVSAGVQFVVTGLVLLTAVLVDAVSRRSQKRAGLA